MGPEQVSHLFEESGHAVIKTEPSDFRSVLWIYDVCFIECSPVSSNMNVPLGT